MRKCTGTVGEESYEMDFNDLAKGIGVELAAGRVARYLNKPYSDNPLIKGGRLIRTFWEYAGEKADTLLQKAQCTFFRTEPPMLDDDEYYDPTDRGLTRIVPEKEKKTNNRKRERARKAKRDA